MNEAHTATDRGTGGGEEIKRRKKKERREGGAEGGREREFGASRRIMYNIIFYDISFLGRDIGNAGYCILRLHFQRRPLAL